MAPISINLSNAKINLKGHLQAFEIIKKKSAKCHTIYLLYS
jgi:hypothetical protein